MQAEEDKAKTEELTLPGTLTKVPSNTNLWYCWINAHHITSHHITSPMHPSSSCLKTLFNYALSCPMRIVESCEIISCVLKKIMFYLLCCDAGLPIQVRDAALNIKDEMPKSEVNKEYYSQNIERQVSLVIIHCTRLGAIPGWNRFYPIQNRGSTFDKELSSRDTCMWFGLLKNWFCNFCTSAVFQKYKVTYGLTNFSCGFWKRKFLNIYFVHGINPK